MGKNIIISLWLVWVGIHCELKMDKQDLQVDILYFNFQPRLQNNFKKEP